MRGLVAGGGGGTLAGGTWAETRTEMQAHAAAVACLGGQRTCWALLETHI